MDPALQQRLESWAALLVEFYEGKDPAAKAALNERLGDERSRAAAWRDALCWLGPARDLDGAGAAYYVSYRRPSGDLRPLEPMSPCTSRGRLIPRAPPG